MGEKILVVEDELTLQETLAYNLKRQGYEVETVGDGKKALELARKTHPDLILLDVMLPGLDGFEVCRILRQEMNTPVLMLTARDDEIDRVVGLELGADDYITKPFSMRELMARIKARLRLVRLIREEMAASSAGGTPAAGMPAAGMPAAGMPAAGLPGASPASMRFGDLVIDANRRELQLGDKIIPLKPKEFELLAFFAQHHGQLLSRELILERVWGWDYIGDSRTVDVHVRWLREKIEQDPASPRRIATVRGAGYRFDG
jgi:DNA-binding response OmpR family regulator